MISAQGARDLAISLAGNGRIFTAMERNIREAVDRGQDYAGMEAALSPVDVVDVVTFLKTHGYTVTTTFVDNFRDGTSTYFAIRW
jgi:hypothetical protein